jgi:nitrate reductase gamma subunit
LSDYSLPSAEQDMSSILPTDSTVDFYVHVTLGPIGVLYVLGTLAFFIRRYIKKTPRQRMEK